MTKSVRVENADTSEYRVRVRVMIKGAGEAPNVAPDLVESERILSHPTMLETFGIHSGKYLVIDELPKA